MWIVRFRVGLPTSTQITFQVSILIGHICTRGAAVKILPVVAILIGGQRHEFRRGSCWYQEKQEHCQREEANYLAHPPTLPMLTGRELFDVFDI